MCSHMCVFFICEWIWRLSTLRIYLSVLTFRELLIVLSVTFSLVESLLSLLPDTLKAHMVFFVFLFSLKSSHFSLVFPMGD